ncbi:MAG: TetR/AcrR family transcriptional regulator, partial [Ktedonobacteraceae bacterium]|nr:TetR/AcrR family transcriptional regulator [Ktedonobacteraceae bacterium]
MKEKHDVDRRIQRTLQMLSNALFALIVERGYEAITVQDITERANIGRATFYLHYRDKEQLLKASMLSLFDELTKHVEPAPDFSATYQSLSIRVFQHVAERRELYYALFQEGGPPAIVIRLHKWLASLIQHRLLSAHIEQCSEDVSTVDAELLSMHCAGSLLALVIWWLNHDLSPAAEQMGYLFWRLISPGINDVLGVKK